MFYALIFTILISLNSFSQQENKENYSFKRITQMMDNGSTLPRPQIDFPFSSYPGADNNIAVARRRAMDYARAYFKAFEAEYLKLSDMPKWASPFGGSIDHKVEAFALGDWNKKNNIEDFSVQKIRSTVRREAIAVIKRYESVPGFELNPMIFRLQKNYGEISSHLQSLQTDLKKQKEQYSVAQQNNQDIPKLKNKIDSLESSIVDSLEQHQKSTHYLYILFALNILQFLVLGYVVLKQD